jgi:hypothetical protein
MGSATIKPLVPTLAILNVRLGYWLINPARIAGALKKSLVARFFDQLYFLKELLGLLREDSEIIYLTDGGHIENLGIYELLRRRCKLIIAIDGEADPDMSFGALVTLTALRAHRLQPSHRSSMGGTARCHARSVRGNSQDRRGASRQSPTWAALRAWHDLLSA